MEAILSHASNADLVAGYTQPQPGQQEKVFVGFSGTPQWIIGGSPGDSLRTLRPIIDNTKLFVDSNDSLWVQVGDPGETQWFLSAVPNPIPNTYNIVNSAGRRWLLTSDSVGTQVTVTPIEPSPSRAMAVPIILDDTIQPLWSCNNGC